MLKLNLQLFAEDEDFVFRGGYNPDEEIQFLGADAVNPLTVDTTEPQEPVVTEPFTTNEVEGTQIAPTTEPYQSPYQQQQPQFSPEMAMIMQQNQMLQQQMAQLQQQMAQPVVNEPQLSVEEQNEKMMEKFYENPSEFFNDLKLQAIEEARKGVDPIIKERQYQNEVQGVANKYGQDFYNSIPQVQQLVNELGEAETERIGLENVYLMARGRSAVAPAPQPQQLVNDPNFLNQYVLNNPQIQQQIIDQYLQGKVSQQPPVVLSNQSGASQPLAQEHKPRSIGEASKLYRKSLGL